MYFKKDFLIILIQNNGIMKKKIETEGQSKCGAFSQGGKNRKPQQNTYSDTSINKSKYNRKWKERKLYIKWKNLFGNGIIIQGTHPHTHTDTSIK